IQSICQFGDRIGSPLLARTHQSPFLPVHSRGFVLLLFSSNLYPVKARGCQKEKVSNSRSVPLLPFLSPARAQGNT
uniref:Uncharacterized protein n=1 Tax=Scleropages formosus TaxID=113540 RepID=A0A8C9WLG5_SCLFO